MVKRTPGLPSPQEIVTAREDLEQNVDETLLLPIFIGRVPARVQAAIDMIADGTVSYEVFFHDHLSEMEDDPTIGKQIPQTVSLLDDLIEINRSSLPDLSPFTEGQFKSPQKPEEQLLEDFGVIDSVFSACRKKRADHCIRQAANDPELIARSWSAFAKRLEAL